MHGFLKVISLSQFFPIHTYSRCTSRAAAEHPQMLVDSARGHFRAHESELFAARHPHFAARPLCSVAEHPAPPSSFPSKGLVLPERLNVHLIDAHVFPGFVEFAAFGGGLPHGGAIDIYVSVSLVGIELLTVDACIVITSVDTDRRLAEAVNRL
jgi:hypothetical protein